MSNSLASYFADDARVPRRDRTGQLLAKIVIASGAIALSAIKAENRFRNFEIGFELHSSVSRDTRGIEVFQTHRQRPQAGKAMRQTIGSIDTLSLDKPELGTCTGFSGGSHNQIFTSLLDVPSSCRPAQSSCVSSICRWHGQRGRSSSPTRLGSELSLTLTDFCKLATSIAVGWHLLYCVNELTRPSQPLAG